MAQIPDAVAALERDVRDIFGSRFQSLVVYGQRAPTRPAATTRITARAGHERAPTHTLVVVETLAAARPAGVRRPPRRVARRGPRHAAAARRARVRAIARRVPVRVRRDPRRPRGRRRPRPRSRRCTSIRADLRRACGVPGAQPPAPPARRVSSRRAVAPTRSPSSSWRPRRRSRALVKTLARLDGRRDRRRRRRRPPRRARDSARPPAPSTDIVALAGVSEISSDAARQLFAPYLEAVERLVAFVDGWGKR